MSNIITSSTGFAPGGTLATGGTDINNTRRIYNFGDHIAEIAPQQSLWFSYLSKMAKKPTDDPIFKQLEKRHQWQRRTLYLGEDVSSATYVAGETVLNTTAALFYCFYNKYGISTDTTEWKPGFILKNQIIAVADSTGTPRQFMVVLTPTSANEAGEVDVKMISMFAESGVVFSDGAKAMVIGTAHEEASTRADGWKDELFSRDGYTQIFRTAIPMFSGSAQATRYRGDANEYKRAWMEKLMENKMDIERAMMFGVGSSGIGYDGITDGAAAGSYRLTNGIVPYTETHGKSYDFSFANTNYDDIVDMMEDFFKPESGNSGSKLVLASSSIISFFSKLGEGQSFLGNTVGKSQYNLDVQNLTGRFGNEVTRVHTTFGDLYLTLNNQLTGLYGDTAIAVDMKNVKYRPLVGNGHNRDTHILTNTQAPDVDGRVDEVLTEAGLQIDLPETHAVLKFS